MILHQLTPIPEDTATPLVWWAVDSASLRLMRCTIARGGRVLIELLVDPAAAAAAPIRSSPAIAFLAPASPAEASALFGLMEREIRLRIGGAQAATVRSGLLQRSALRRGELPAYLLLASADGECNGILHTADPAMLYLAEAGVLQPPAAYCCQLDLPVSGWLYYHDGAQQEFDELTAAYLQEATA